MKATLRTAPGPSLLIGSRITGELAETGEVIASTGFANCAFKVMHTATVIGEMTNASSNKAVHVKSLTSLLRLSTEIRLLGGKKHICFL